MIYVAGCAKHFQRHAMRLRQLRQRVHVRFGEYAAHAGSGLQAAGGDFLVETERQRQVHGVSIYALAERGHFVDERNLGRHEGGGSFAHQFRGRLVGHDDGHAPHDQGMKNLLQHLHGFAGGRSQDQAVGPVEILDGATIGKEHRLRHDGGLQSRVLDVLFQSACGADRSRSDNRQNRGLGRQPRDAHGHIDQTLGFVFGEENDLRLAGKRFDIGGVGEPARTHVAPDDFLKILFEEGNVALGHLDHARPVGMTAGNWSAKIRQAGRNHRSQVP